MYTPFFHIVACISMTSTTDTYLLINLLIFIIKLILLTCSPFLLAKSIPTATSSADLGLRMTRGRAKQALLLTILLRWYLSPQQGRTSPVIWCRKWDREILCCSCNPETSSVMQSIRRNWQFMTEEQISCVICFLYSKSLSLLHF